MRTCKNCNGPLNEYMTFCPFCGTKVEIQEEQQPTVVPTSPESITKEEEFIQTTARILRWEQKAYSIYGKFATIFGAITTGMYSLLTFACLGSNDPSALLMFALTLVLAYMLFSGIVAQAAAKRINFYLQTMHSNPTYMLKRCGSTGMIVFSFLLGGISFIFFIINYARIENNTSTVRQIYQNHSVL